MTDNTDLDAAIEAAMAQTGFPDGPPTEHNRTYARALITHLFANLEPPEGAPCTTELKRLPLMPYWTLEREHVFGFDVSEADRLKRLQEREAPFKIRSILIEKGLSKKDCFAILDDAGIALPEMYKLGFRNANCIGCPKGGKGYWNHVRKVFPERFAEVAALQRELGEGAAFWEGEDARLMLDELSQTAGRHEPFDMSCDMFCSDIVERAA